MSVNSSVCTILLHKKELFCSISLFFFVTLQLKINITFNYD